jgi:hypothetical protein
MISDRLKYFDPESSIFYVGLDLGQARDPSAIALIERCGDPPLYSILQVKRFPLGTRYPEIVSRVAFGLQNHRIQPNRLAIDFTGVGRAVADVFRENGVPFLPITLHGGKAVSSSGGSYNVPKRDLVTRVSVLLEQERLKISPQMKEAQTLREELSAFSVRISQSGHDQYGAFGENEHDDLVIAVALAVWTGEAGFLPRGMRFPRPPRRRSERRMALWKGEVRIPTKRSYMDVRLGRLLGA